MLLFSCFSFHGPEMHTRKREEPSSPSHSRSASAHTIQGFFPPSSSVTLFRLLRDAASLTSFPTFKGKNQALLTLRCGELSRRRCRHGWVKCPRPDASHRLGSAGWPRQRGTPAVCPSTPVSAS